MIAVSAQSTAGTVSENETRSQHTGLIIGPALGGELREGRRLYPAADGLNPSTERVIVAGLVSLIGNRLLAGQVERLSDCEPELVELALAPFVGAERARGLARP